MARYKEQQSVDSINGIADEFEAIAGQLRAIAAAMRAAKAEAIPLKLGTATGSKLREIRENVLRATVDARIELSRLPNNPPPKRKKRGGGTRNDQN